jgi:signal transduction histidine kinase
MRNFIFFSLCIAGVLVFCFYHNFRKSKLKLHKELVESLKKIIELEESQRGKIAMELHDIISPLYSYLHQEFKNNGPPKDPSEKVRDIIT